MQCLNMQCKRRENSKMPNEIKRKLKNAGSTVLNIMKERTNRPSGRAGLRVRVQASITNAARC